MNYTLGYVGLHGYRFTDKTIRSIFLSTFICLNFVQGLLS